MEIRSLIRKVSLKYVDHLTVDQHIFSTQRNDSNGSFLHWLLILINRRTNTYEGIFSVYKGEDLELR